MSRTEGAKFGALGLCLVLAVQGCLQEQPSGHCSLDVDAIKAADRAYAKAWLANDPAMVMATLTEDAVLMPSGIPTLNGTSQIRAFWWPDDSPPATVTDFDIVQQEVGRNGDLAFVRGSFMLRFEYEGDLFSNIGDYMSLMRCVSNGSWKISHRVWNDLPPPSD